jgi:hypothetical protein
MSRLPALRWAIAAAAVVVSLAGSHVPFISKGSPLPLRVPADYPPLGPRQQLLAVSMAGQPAACPTAVFLKTGPDSYLPYGLLGGP